MKVLEFLGLSHWGSLAGLIIFFVILFGISRLPKKKYSFAARVLMGSGAGTLYGLAAWALSGGMSAGMNADISGGMGSAGSGMGGALAAAPFAQDLDRWFSLIGTGYVSLFQFLITPVIFIAAVRLVIRTPLEKTVSPLTRWKKRVNTSLLAVSALVASCLGLYFEVGAAPGAGIQIFAWNTEAGYRVTDAAARLIPSSLGLDLLTGNVVGIFVFAVFVGIAARRMSGKYMDTVKPFLDLVNAAFSVTTSVCKAIIAYKPMGAAAIMASLTAVYGPAAIWMLIKLLLVLCLAAVVMLVVQLILCALSGVGPAAFIRAGKVAMKKALVTRSGSACLPEAQQALSEGLGLKKEITDQVAAYAISSGMQGCGAMFPAMAAVFAAGLSGITVTPGLVFSLVVVITLCSYGITDVPGTATMAEFAAVLGSGMGGAVPGLGPMIAIDPIGDVPRTLINVTGCMTNAIIVERRVRT